MIQMFRYFLVISFLFSASISFADKEDGVAVLNNEPTEKAMQAVRDGAKTRCENVEEEDEKQQCVADYYAQHNLEEEPSCD
ncbi:hypothetical protein MNB_SUP05-5-319 [hydrothermal vent metagenome]|uniref:Uncharacterized protein n=1 Tax=hydrothermal vent metagenome TaxID=652676 RepID=A0A1W1BN00_9ZZZZ